MHQAIDECHLVVDVANMLGIEDKILYKWIKKFKDIKLLATIDVLKPIHVEPNRLKAKLRRTTEQSDIQ